MKIKSDKLWQEQMSVLRNALDEDTMNVYIEVIKQVAEGAEKDEGVQNSLTSSGQPEPAAVIESVREEFRKIVTENGYLIPDVLSSVLTVLILHWEYGEALSSGLSAIEFSLVAEAMARHLEMKAEEATFHA